MVFAESIFYQGMAVAVTSVAAFHDLKGRRIPNLLTGPAALMGLLLHLFLGGPLESGLALLGGLIGGGIFLLFYLAGGMGAGDVKLMAAVGCVVGWMRIKDVLLTSVIVGAVLALALAIVRGRLMTTLRNVITLMGHHRIAGLTAHPELNVANEDSLRLPYALPIAIGNLILFSMEITRGARS